MVIAGTHGNEPAGIKAAEFLIDNVKISRGTLIIIPKANILACKKELRSYPKGINLNRVYPGKKEGNIIEKIAYEIFNMMESNHVNFLIDLHESREFYKINSQNYGQTIVLDCYDNELLEICSSLVEELNRNILPEKEKFEILIKPIEGCATFAASCQLGIPAFTFETCKKISLSDRIAYQKSLTEMILLQMGLIE